MGELTIGRLGLNTEGVNSLEQITLNGDQLSVSAVLLGTNLAALRALRQSALGLANNRDEPVVPLTYSGDSDLDGYYSVRSVNCGSVPATLTAFWHPFTVDLERVPDGFAAPLLEARLRAVDRANNHGVAGARSWHAVPSAAAAYYPAANTKDTLDTETGDVKMFTGSGATSDFYFDKSPSWFLAPASYYNGSCRIETAGVPVIGRQIRNAPTDWILGNGLVRIKPGAAAGDLNVQVFDGTSWEGTTKDFEGFFESGGSTYALAQNPSAITVLRNTPEDCRLRLSYTGEAVGPLANDEWGYTLDLRVRRGARFIECFLSSDRSAKFGFRRAAAEAHSTLNVDGTGTGGIRATANDADGNRFLITSPTTFTEIANGAVHLTTGATSFRFGVGYELGGSGATGRATAEEVGLAYYVAGGERQRVVVR